MKITKILTPVAVLICGVGFLAAAQPGVAPPQSLVVEPATEEPLPEEVDPRLARLLEAARFNDLELGMKRTEVHSVVGVPNFTRVQDGREEHIYIFPGGHSDAYQFISLFFELGNQTLVDGRFKVSTSPDFS